MSTSPSGEASIELGDEAEEEVETAPQRRSVAVTVLPAWRLEGHVRDSEGRGIVGAEVLCSGLQTGAAITDEAGFYRFDFTTWPGVSAVSFTGLYLYLQVWAPGFQPINDYWVELPSDVPEREFVLVEDLVLEAGGSVLGTVQDKFGETVRGVSVQLHQAGSEIGQVRTAHDGSFRLLVPRDGVYELSAIDGRLGVALVRISLKADRDHRQDLRLVPKSALRGQFVYPDGQPVADLRVGAYLPGRSHGDDGVSGAGGGIDVTGPDGHFALEGLKPGEYRLSLLQILDAALRRNQQASLVVRTDQREERMVLPLHRLTVEVIDERGLALTGGQIRLMGWLPEHGLHVQRLADGVPLPDGIRDALAVSTPKRDHFVSPGTWWVISTGRGERHAWAIVEASPSSNETTVRLQFRRTDFSTGVRVTAIDVEGASFSGLTVRLGSVVPWVSYSNRIEDGSKSLFVHAPPGRYHLWVSAVPQGEYLWHDEDVILVAGQRKEIEVTLVKGGRLGWTLRVPGISELAEIRGLEVDVKGPETQTLKVFSRRNEDGTYGQDIPRNEEAFTHPFLLRPGRYEVTLRLPGYQPFRTSTVLRAGETTSIEVFPER